MDAQQVHNLYLGVVAVWRQEVYVRCLTVDMRCQLLHRSSLVDAHLCGQVGHRWRKAHPYDVLHVNVVAEKPFFVLVNIDDAHQPVAVLSEVVQE